MAIIPPSTKERMSKDFFRSCVDSFYDRGWHNGARGDALIRDITDRDLGVDCILEILDSQIPTGMFALIQLKSTEKEIETLAKTPGTISCSNVSRSNLHYCRQNKIPMILVYIHVDIESNACDNFFFGDIREEGMSLLAEKYQEKYTLHIPADNCNNIQALLEMIEMDYR